MELVRQFVEVNVPTFLEDLLVLHNFAFLMPNIIMVRLINSHCKPCYFSDSTTWNQGRHLVPLWSQVRADHSQPVNLHSNERQMKRS